MALSRKAIMAAYQDAGIARDHLPYTPQFDQFVQRVSLGQTHRQVWEELLKAG